MPENDSSGASGREHDRRQTDDDLDEFDVELPASEGDEDGPVMTLRELREAVEDESHPRHAYAVKRQAELAERLRPAIAKLQESMLDQSGVKEAMNKFNSRIAQKIVPKIKTGVDFNQVFGPSIDLPISPSSKLVQQVNEPYSEIAEAAARSAEAREQRQQVEDRRAEDMLGVLISVDAQLGQLNSKIAGVDTQIREGNSSASRLTLLTLIIAALTLVATIVGIAIAN